MVKLTVVWGTPTQEGVIHAALQWPQGCSRSQEGSGESQKLRLSLPSILDFGAL